MKSDYLGMLLFTISLLSAAMPAFGADNLTVASVPGVVPGGTVTVPVRISNSQSIRSVTVPLIIRQGSGNASVQFVKLSWGDRLPVAPGAPLSSIVINNLFIPPESGTHLFNCIDGFGQFPAYTDTSFNPITVLPVGALFNRHRIFDPDLAPGTDPTGSLLLTLTVGQEEGCIEIDTTCIEPSNHLNYTAGSPSYTIIPTFQSGEVCVAGPSEEPMTVQIDVKPGSCPNPLNVPAANGKAGKAYEGVIPIAILGSGAFEIGEIETSSIRLLGIAPLRCVREDVASPTIERMAECECAVTEKDRVADLVCHFRRYDILAALHPAEDQEHMPVTMTGRLRDGREFSGMDCVLIRGRAVSPEPALKNDASAPGGVTLENYPNPFNASTTITFSLDRPVRTNLVVYNLMGQKVRTLADDHLAPGVHSIEWDGTDESNRTVASGIYFYRLVAGDVVLSRKMSLLK